MCLIRWNCAGKGNILWLREGIGGLVLLGGKVLKRCGVRDVECWTGGGWSQKRRWWWTRWRVFMNKSRWGGHLTAFVEDIGMVTTIVHHILNSLQSAIRQANMIHSGSCGSIMILSVTKKISTVVVLNSVGKSVVLLKQERYSLLSDYLRSSRN